MENDLSLALEEPGLERRLMLLLIFGIICLVAGPALSAEPEHKYDGVYTGKRSLTKGTASTTSPLKMKYQLLLPAKR
jgi:hypothetical protein